MGRFVHKTLCAGQVESIIKFLELQALLNKYSLKAY